MAVLRRRLARHAQRRCEHGGTVNIQSGVGTGTEVTVTFPERRVLGGPRGEVLAAPTIESESQRKLIAITG